MIWESTNFYDKELLKDFSKKFNLSEKMVHVLFNRNIKEEKNIIDFMNPDISKMRDPHKFENMDYVVKKIIDKKNKKEKIYIYGDYDVDGITAAAFLNIVFKKVGINVDYYIPDRMEEGYGLNKNAIDYMKSQGATLVITVDMGVNSQEEIDYCKSLGIEIIVTDHHKMTNEYPEIVTLNPKLSETYLFKYLSGAGVALKVAEAVYKELKVNSEILYEYIDIVMIGTVADVVPMVDENRIIIKKGLETIKKTKVKGLTYLLNYLKLKYKDITTTDVSFFISPLLNALGRIENSKIGVEFFLEEDDFAIYNIIEEMKNANKKRRSLERIIFTEVMEQIGENVEDLGCIFLKSDKWHPGVIGVVAAKLSIKFNVPVLLISIKDGVGKASCRSSGNINIFEILKENSHHLIRFGGHDLAAGFIAKVENLKIIEENIRKRIVLNEKTEVPVKTNIAKIDLEIELEEINDKMMKEIKSLSPFGIENPYPIFCTRDVYFTNVKKFGVENQHFKTYIAKNNKSYSAVAFNLGENIEEIVSPAQLFDIIYYPELVNIDDVEMIQLKIKDFKIKENFNDVFIKEE